MFRCMNGDPDKSKAGMGVVTAPGFRVDIEKYAKSFSGGHGRALRIGSTASSSHARVFIRCISG